MKALAESYDSDGNLDVLLHDAGERLYIGTLLLGELGPESAPGLPTRATPEQVREIETWLRAALEAAPVPASLVAVLRGK